MNASPDRKKDKNGKGLFKGRFIDQTDDKTIKVLPDGLFFWLTLTALAIPNIVFSGPRFFDTLHLMKWVFAMAPVAIMAIVGGIRLCLYGRERTGFTLDSFGLLWLIMLLYITAQPLWVDVTSWSTFFKEWFFFASLVGMYIFCFNMFHGKAWHKTILWVANVNAALNVIFAELLMRGLNAGIPFIMNVPGNYIGNTGQQEMFGLWMAVTLMNGLYLHVAGQEGRAIKYDKPLKAANLFLTAVNAWGLWNSTTRGSIAALLVGTAILGLLVWRTQQNRDIFKRMAHIALAIVAMLIITLVAGKMFEFGRAASLVSKTADMVTNISSIGGRRGIWRTSIVMVKAYALGGVGIGHYKWHYIEAQSKTLQKYPDMDWVYTYWAHSEYIQWFAEFGLFGALFLLSVGAWWLWRFAKATMQKKVLSLEAVWAASMLFLIWFDAVFSRPFHRIENVIWAAFAFAIVNREILPLNFKPLAIKSPALYKLFGASVCAVALSGLLFLGCGMRGDLYLRDSMRTNNAALQARRINNARRMIMMRDEAEERYAYHLIAFARATQKRDDWDKAIAQFCKSYKIRPTGAQLIDLVNLARQQGYNDVFRELLPLAQQPPVRSVSERPQTSPDR